MDLLELLNSNHPAFDEHADMFDYHYRAYVGAWEWRKGEYLRKYFAEHLAPYDVYSARLQATPFDNHVKTVIDVYRSFVFQNSPKRSIETLDSNPFVEDWMNDVDLEGQGIDSFMKTAMDWAMVYGNVWVGVDKPAYNAQTAGEELDAGIRAYATLYTPQNVRDWVWERDFTGRKRLTYLRVVEDSTEEYDVLKLWTPENCRRVVAEKEPRTGEYKAVLEMDDLPNALGYVPFVNIVPVAHEHKGLGHSIIADVADVSRSIYNKLSELEQNIRLSVHPSLVKTAETSAEGGAGNIIEVPEDLPADKNPYLLQPTGASIEGILSAIERDIDSINSMTHLTAVRAQKSQAASGVSLTVERQLLNSKLSDLADTVEEAEVKLWNIFMDWQGIVKPDGFKVEYDRAYDIRDNQQDMNLLVRSLEVIPTEEYKEYVAVEVAKMLIEDDDELGLVLKSIAAYDKWTPEEDADDIASSGE